MFVTWAATLYSIHSPTSCGPLTRPCAPPWKLLRTPVSLSLTINFQNILIIFRSPTQDRTRGSPVVPGLVVLVLYREGVAGEGVPEEGMLQQLGGCPPLSLFSPQAAAQEILEAGGQQQPTTTSAGCYKKCVKIWQLLLYPLPRYKGDKNQAEAENVGFFAAAAEWGRIGVS